MALPLVLPAASAVASAIAEASGVALASGLTAKLLLDRIRSNYDVGNTETIANELMWRNNIGTASHIKSATLNIPTAENALVLRPEYRTVSLPTSLNWSGFKPLWNEQSSTEESQQTGAIAEETVIGGTPDPEDEKDKKIKELEEKLKQLESKPKNDGSKNEKGFKKGLKKGWEHTKKAGSIMTEGLGYGISGLLPPTAVGLGAYGLYKLFSSDKEDNNTNDEDGVSLKPMTWAK